MPVVKKYYLKIINKYYELEFFSMYSITEYLLKQYNTTTFIHTLGHNTKYSVQKVLILKKLLTMVLLRSWH